MKNRSKKECLDIHRNKNLSGIYIAKAPLWTSHRFFLQRSNNAFEHRQKKRVLNACTDFPRVFDSSVSGADFKAKCKTKIRKTERKKADGVRVS